MSTPADRQGREPLGAAWSQVLAAGGTVTFAQRRGPAALMFLGAVVLLGVEVAALGTVEPAGVHRGPWLLIVTLVTLGLFIPVPLWRALTGRPRLAVSPTQIRYGRHVAAWTEIGKVRLVNGGKHVEVGARGRARRFRWTTG